MSNQLLSRKNLKDFSTIENKKEGKENVKTADIASGDRESEDAEDAEIVEEKELVLEEKESSSDEDDTNEKVIKEVVDPDKCAKWKKKYDLDILERIFWNEFERPPDESVYVNPMTYFECDDPKANHLLNTTFVDKYGSKVKSDYALKNKDVVALYFSNCYCLRGQHILGMLKDIHLKAQEIKKKFEVVYVSFDYTKEEMMHELRFNHGNWFGIEFDEPIKDAIKHMYGVIALPQIIVIDSFGSTITATGITEVEQLGINVLVTWF